MKSKRFNGRSKASSQRREKRRDLLTELVPNPDGKGRHRKPVKHADLLALRWYGVRARVAIEGR